jgi:hypothetical protein
VLRQHASERGAAFAQLKRAVHRAAGPAAPAAARTHYTAVAALTAAHLTEMWTLRLFGPAQLERELAHLA